MESKLQVLEHEISTQIRSIIEKGEGIQLEFKSCRHTLNNNVYETVCAFLNRDPLHFSPYPQNPVLARFFKEIGWAEELGSGVCKLHKYSTLYGGAQAELIEGDIFKINVPLTPEVTPEVTQEVTPEVRNRNILEFCRQPRSMTEIMEHTGLKDREHFRREILKPLIDQDLLQLTIPDKPTSRLQKYVRAEDEPVNPK